MSDLSDLQARAGKLERDSFNELWTLVAATASTLTQLNPTQRRPWLASVVADMRIDQDNLCALCGEPLTDSDIEVDHKVPFCYGGGHERANLQLAHMACNRNKRATVDPHDLLRYLEDRYMNR